MTESTDSIEFHRAEEWTAVYLNGELQRVGDNYLADEWLQIRCGVKVVDDDAFLKGQGAYEGVAQNLDDVSAFREARDAKLSRAAELRAQAARLEAEAKGLLA